jgi:transcriptional regulator with XRE-family HTH domain
MKRRTYGRYTPLGKWFSETVGTQVKIAKIMGVSQQTCSKRMRGECAITLKQFAKIAKKLKKKPSEILAEIGI